MASGYCLCIILVVVQAFLPIGAALVEHAFSTKTGYNYCGLKSFQDRETEAELQRCKLIHTTGLFRHGTRSPSKKDSDSFMDFYNRAKTSASQGALLPAGFLSHPVPFQNNDPEKHLLEAGYDEHRRLGESLMIMAAINNFTYDLKNTEFYSSSIKRSIESGRAFYNSLFNWTDWYTMQKECRPESTSSACRPNGYQNFSDYVTVMNSRFEINDDLIRFFDFCPRYQAEVKRNKTAYEQHEIFRNSNIMQHLLSDFVGKYRLGSGYSTDDLKLIYLACGHELANDYPSRLWSPWCQFMNETFIYTLEYMSDVKQYWQKSYPHSVSYVQACPLLNELLAKLKRAAVAFKRNHANLNRGTFWFGHAETVLPIITLLGLFNDSLGSNIPITLTANLGWQRRLRLLANRQWPAYAFRSGFITPFAGNIIFNLYHCPAKAASERDSLLEFMVQPLVNGQTVAWPLAGSVQPPTHASPGRTATSLKVLLDAFSFCSPAEFSSKDFCALHSTGSITQTIKLELFVPLIVIHLATTLLW